MSFRTAIVHQTFSGRYVNKQEAIEAANEIGAKVCHLWYTNVGIECSFGFALYIGDEILDCETDYTWI